MTKFYESFDGLNLAYLDHGEGFPLVMLPGLTRNAQDFDFLVPHLPDIRIIRPDYRGRGKSDFADPATYTIPSEANDILRLLDHLNLDKVAILGTSRGGLIAMAMASVAKNRLHGVFLNDVGPDINQAGLETISQYLGRRPSQKTYEEVAKARAKFMTGFRNVSHERWLEEARAHYIETDSGLELRYDPKLRDAFLSASDAPMPDIWPLFDAFSSLPLGLLRGETSDILSQKTADSMRKRRPDMKFSEVKDRGHVPFLDEPESLETIRSWLKEMV